MLLPSRASGQSRDARGVLPALQASVPPFSELTAVNFDLYERIGLPMLMLFVDPAKNNFNVMQAFRSACRCCCCALRRSEKPSCLWCDAVSYRLPCSAVSRDQDVRRRISFVWVDGVTHGSRMWSLGLRPGALPGIAFNLKDRRRLVFPEDAPITSASLLRFCREFLMGRVEAIAEDSSGSCRSRCRRLALAVLNGFYRRCGTVQPLASQQQLRQPLNESRCTIACQV